MKTLFSGLSFIIQIVLVVAGVLVFAWFDPFNIFTSSKLTIRDTPSHVKQIKEIGELITAEFYGEVISSYHDSQILEAVEKKSKILSEVEELDELFTQGLKDIWKLENEKDQFRQFNILCDKLDNDQRFFSEYLDVIKSKFDLGIFNRKKTLLEKLATYDLSEESTKKQRIESVMKKKAITNAEGKIDKQIDKKKQLILLARGKVQAGFKFNKLDNRNIRVDTLRHRILIVGFNPEILSCSINPWFIPELGIKGFEIIDMTGKSDEVKIFNKVKSSCKDSLEMKAIQSGILEKAKRNAEKNLQTFFSIILNNNDLSVKIIANELDYYDKTLLDEKDITINELKLMDTLLGNSFANKVDTVKIYRILNTLKTKILIMDMKTIPLSIDSKFDSIARKYFVNQEMLTHWRQWNILQK